MDLRESPSGQFTGGEIAPPLPGVSHNNNNDYKTASEKKRGSGPQKKNDRNTSAKLSQQAASQEAYIRELAKLVSYVEDKCADPGGAVSYVTRYNLCSSGYERRCMRRASHYLKCPGGYDK